MLKKLRKMLKQQEGFTLVELMIVVVILGIISGIGIQQYGQVQERARKAADEANVRIIRSAVQMYLMVEEKPKIGELFVKDLVPDYLEDPPKSPWSSNTDTYKITIEDSDKLPPTIKVENTEHPDYKAVTAN